mgnify:CR=1 FL=1
MVLALVLYLPNLAIVRKAKWGVRSRRVSGEWLGSPSLLLLLLGTLLKDHPRLAWVGNVQGIVQGGKTRCQPIS